MRTKELIYLSEEELLDNTDYYPYISSLLQYRQFSEDFLSKTIYFYNSWNCIKFKKNLTPYFCFRYLYDNKTDSCDNWSSYDDIEEYFKNSKYSHNDLEAAYNLAMFERKN
jgi:hypothetical protein